MFLRYKLPDGKQHELKLGKEAVTIGRSADSDICIPDKLASRSHCGISPRGNMYFLRDFKSRNGTFVNEHRIDVVQLRPGDRIRIGSTSIAVESLKRSKGAETVLHEIKQEMDKGKGYHTMLMEIIEEKDGENKQE